MNLYRIFLQLRHILSLRPRHLQPEQSAEEIPRVCGLRHHDFRAALQSLSRLPADPRVRRRRGGHVHPAQRAVHHRTAPHE